MSAPSPLAALRGVLRRLHGLVRRRQVGARLTEEVEFHLEMAAEKHRRAGMPPDAARRAALASFGGRDRWEEAARDEATSRPLEDLAQDLRYAARTLRRSPAFTLTAVLTLGVGIGADTAIFSVVDGALLKPLPYADAERIVVVFQRDVKRGTERDDVSPANFLDWRERARSFSTLATAEPYSVDVEGPDGPEMIRNWNVSEGFFDVLGVRPFLGRLFEPADFQQGRERVVVISYESWQRRYGGDPGVLGRRMRIERMPATIVGVLPPNAGYPAGREMWAPKIFTDMDAQIRSSAFYRVVGRLAPGATTATAAAEMRTLSAQLAREQPRSNADISTSVIPIDDVVSGGARKGLLILLGAVGLVLLVACANVANLLLARTARRGREIAIRAALGAGRGRVVRQLLAESLTLALAGAAAGVALAIWCVSALRAMAPANLPRVGEMQVNARALGFALGAAVLTALLCGLAPSLRAARGDWLGAGPALNDALRSGGRGLTTGRRQRRVRGALVAGEVALAVLLLVGAGLLVRSFVTLLRVDRGYRSENVLAVTLFIWQWYETPAKRAQFVEEASERFRAIPGVVAAGAMSGLPVAERIGAAQTQFTLEGEEMPADKVPSAIATAVSPQSFDVLRIPLRTGRSFAATDDATHPPVVLINESMARRYWPNESPLGKRIRMGFYSAAIPREVIGVVGDIRQNGLDVEPQPAIYVPHAQAPTGSLVLVLRTERDPVAALPAVRRTLGAMNRELPIAVAATMDAVLSDSLKLRRFNLVLLASFALTALVLAVIGVYGLLAQGTAERRQELGVRIALGARSADVVGLVMREGIAPALLGIVLGLGAAAALTRLLQGMLYEVTPLDRPTFVAVTAVVLGTAVLACWLPAWRATRIDPLAAIRAE